MQIESPSSFHPTLSTVETPTVATAAAASTKEAGASRQKQPVRSTNNSTSKKGDLEHIFQSVKKQIEQWGENAKWKIDLILLDNNSTSLPKAQSQQQQQPAPPQRKNSIHPLLSPQLLHPNAITTPADSSNATQYSNIRSANIPITATVQYPWDFVAPKYVGEFESSYFANTDLQAKLHESFERQKHLENIIWSQAEQLRHVTTSMSRDIAINDAINTMRDIYLFAQNEQKVQYLTETNMLRGDIDKLSSKLKNMARILERMEQFELPAEETHLDREALLTDRKQMLRKLHLAELRLNAKDAEIGYLYEIVHFLKSTAHGNHYYQPSMYPPSPRPFQQSQYGQHHPQNRKFKANAPYLFQQQFSPYSSSATTSEVRSSEPQHPLSALDSLGIVADQMLSDPEFENNPMTFKSEAEEAEGEDLPAKRFRTRLNDRRSQRSMDSAATLLAMPQLMFPPQRSALSKVDEMSSSTSSSPSPEQPKVTSIGQVTKKPRSTYTRWTEAEDKLLRAAVKKYGHSNWEACARDIKGRSNIQCRNRWIRHLEHRLVPREEAEEDAEADEEKEDEDEQLPSKKLKQVAEASTPTPTPVPATAARHSPSIAALLNSDSSGKKASKAIGNESPYLHPTNHPYTPPSPMHSPKHKKRRTAAAEVSNQKP